MTKYQILAKYGLWDKKNPKLWDNVSISRIKAMLKWFKGIII